ncbi:MAG: hypothetical protein ACRC67_18230 [Inquilinus sp.]|uniref:hypothetical protein n=1 Tax=Inquilinus sp. TaxID=1932117 RepID=UPI003F388E05
MQNAADDPSRPNLVTKAEFARLTKRSPGRVSQWIKAGQLHGAALVDDNGVEKIDADVARAQLGLSLDPTQLIAQGALPLPASDEDDPDVPEAAPAPRAPRAEPMLPEDQRRMLKAKADEQEIRTQRARQDLLAQNGQWIRVADVRRTWQRGLADLLSRIEAAFPDMGEAIAAEAGGDARRTTIALGRQFRELRQKLGDQAAEARDRLPAEAPADEVAA